MSNGQTTVKKTTRPSTQVKSQKTQEAKPVLDPDDLSP